MGGVQHLMSAKAWRIGIGAAVVAMMAGCAPVETPTLNDQYVSDLASAGSFTGVEGRIITDNDAAFQAKLDLIRRAEKSIDAMYYIYADDLSSSVMSMALLDAAKRGVKVRLLVDYLTNYSRLDHFSMMEREARKSGGDLEVRFFNRPTRNIIKNAAYLTSGCVGTSLDAPDRACSQAKTANIDAFFAGEKIDGVEAKSLNISNRNTGSPVFSYPVFTPRNRMSWPMR